MLICKHEVLTAIYNGVLSAFENLLMSFNITMMLFSSQRVCIKEVFGVIII